jgi:hypothetical protein
MNGHRTRMDGFIAGAVLNMDALDALEAISSSQREVTSVALSALGEEYGVRDEIGFRAVVTVLGDIHETLDVLKDTAQCRGTGPADATAGRTMSPLLAQVVASLERTTRLRRELATRPPSYGMPRPPVERAPMPRSSPPRW